MNYQGDRGDRFPASVSNETVVNVINYERNYLGINPQKKIKGFVHNEGKDGVYMQRLFGEILQIANSLAKDDFYFPEDGIYRFYNTFLLNALLVPYHESSLMHLTHRSTDKCYLANDLVDFDFLGEDSALSFIKKVIGPQRDVDISLSKKVSLLSNSSKSTLRVWLRKNIAPDLDLGLTRFFNLTKHPRSLFPACHKFDEDKFTQLLFAGDYSDIGIYQLNSEYHFEMMRDDRIFNTVETIKYGVSYLYQGHNKLGGFKALSNNRNEYECLQSDSDSVDLYKDIARGNWAGQFNSGQLKASCRFTNIYLPDARDESFVNSLETFIMAEKEGLKPNSWALFLPEDSIEKMAYLELISNFKNLENSRVYIDKVLKTDYSQISLIDYTDNKLSDPSESTIEKFNQNIPKEDMEGESIDLSFVHRLEPPQDKIEKRKFIKSGEFCKIPSPLRSAVLNKPAFTKENLSSQRYIQDYVIGPGRVDIIDERASFNDSHWFATYDERHCKKVWFFVSTDEDILQPLK